MIGCAKTEMVSEDNTVTNENIVTTTGTIAIETEVTETEAIEMFFASTNYLKMQRHFPKVAAGNSSKLHKLPEAC